MRLLTDKLQSVLGQPIMVDYSPVPAAPWATES